MPTFERPKAFVIPPDAGLVTEPEDALVPEGTWIADFVASMRGIETPTIFTLWGALWALSTASAREIGFEWLEDELLYPNLYVILVAPPARCRKSTSLRHAFKVLERLAETYVPDPDDPDLETTDLVLEQLATFNWATSKTTPEALEVLLEPPPTMNLHGRDGLALFDKGSQVSLLVSELTTFLSKRKYMTGMIDTLTDLYDCPERHSYNTIARGNVILEKVYLTFIGATTPTSLKDALPPEAFGEGFMSRVCVIFKETTLRRFSKPVHLDGFPTIEELAIRLAYVIRHAIGEPYRETPEAEVWFNSWYNVWKDTLEADDGYVDRTGEYRFDVMIRRLALLIAISRYDRDAHVIDVLDYEQAKALLEGSYRSAMPQTQRLAAAEGFQTHYLTIRNYINKKAVDGKIERRKILSYMSSTGVSSKEVDTVLSQLEDEGAISCLESNKARTKKGELAYRIVSSDKESFRGPTPQAPRSTTSGVAPQSLSALASGETI